MVLEGIRDLQDVRTPLTLVDLPIPVARENEILIRVSACGVCHTELDEIEGRTPPPVFPVILGHQIVGRVEKQGNRARRFRIGDKVGVAWIHEACGRCQFCLEGKENLCYDFKATGRDAHGGYAEYTTVSEDFAYKIPAILSDLDVAPLLCAGAVGYRSLKLCGMKDGDSLGLVGFGASAHLVIQMVRHAYPNSRVFVFSRTEGERDFAKELGAFWAGDIDEESPEKLCCAIDTTPAWMPIIEALKNLKRGGRLVINAIRKEERDKESLLKLEYPHHLWMEKEIKSVANITRRDVDEFLQLAAQVPIRAEVQEFELAEATTALMELKERKIRGAKVLRIE